MRRPLEGQELLRQFDEIGSKSLPLVALAGAAIGFVLSLESRSSLVHFGAQSMLPAALVYSIIHETGPIVTGLVVSGRVGAGIGAELGSAKVTEQIDAIEASGVNPYASFWRSRASWPASLCFSADYGCRISARCSSSVGSRRQSGRAGILPKIRQSGVCRKRYLQRLSSRTHLQNCSSSD